MWRDLGPGGVITTRDSGMGRGEQTKKGRQCYIMATNRDHPRKERGKKDWKGGTEGRDKKSDSTNIGGQIFSEGLRRRKKGK